MQQRIHQRAAIAFVIGRARAGMYRHARRLVYYGKLCVLKDDVQGNVFRHRPQRRLRSRSEDGDVFASAQPQRRPRNGIIHRYHCCVISCWIRARLVAGSCATRNWSNLLPASSAVAEIKSGGM